MGYHVFFYLVSVAPRRERWFDNLLSVFASILFSGYQVYLGLIHIAFSSRGWQAWQILRFIVKGLKFLFMAYKKKLSLQKEVFLLCVFH